MKLTFKHFISEMWEPKKFTKEEAKEIFDYLINGDEPSTSASDKLYELLFDKMPYGVKKARISTPEEWYGDYFGNMDNDTIQDWIDENTEK